tara:strand:+ start:50539 stop:50844 length:306 start_codon:yes stop_codon:yes gene_type:complete
MGISSKVKNIVLCDNCKGRGEIHSHTTYYRKCVICNGSGRVWKEKISFELPSDTDRHILQNVENEISTFLRELNRRIKTEDFIRESKINGILLEVTTKYDE